MKENKLGDMKKEILDKLQERQTFIQDIVKLKTEIKRLHKETDSTFQTKSKIAREDRPLTKSSSASMKI